MKVNRTTEHLMSPHKVCTCKRKIIIKKNNTNCKCISVNMLLWRPSIAVVSMLGLQLKWQILPYLHISKIAYLFCCKTLDQQTLWWRFRCGLPERTTENTNTCSRHMKSRWMDVVRKRSEECSFADKDEAILMSSFPLDLQGGHRSRVHRQTGAFRRLEPRPTS